MPQTNFQCRLSCPIHVVTFTLISTLATDYIQKRRGQALLFSFWYYLWICHLTWYQSKRDYMDRASKRAGKGSREINPLINYEKLLSWIFHIFIGFFFLDIVESTIKSCIKPLSYFFRVIYLCSHIKSVSWGMPILSYFFSLKMCCLRQILFYLFCGM